MEVKISKWGNSQGVRLPLNIIRQMGIENFETVKLNIKVDKEGTLTLKKISPKVQYADYFKNFDLKEWEDQQKALGGFENRAAGTVEHELF
ncbi:AbrB/MazE/SpoVT family DNA-binding domain-containing protein [Schleiferilactobacillus harbinensis]|uniref:AbrB/MazE/SpoVT family DNA-binding domain-containing protein n=1 Tax=Schleiferilactobacillus harbinensis TaxID=304207 RepID=UPI002430C867|nr:AbrB/MazE/SpoVT family DNA-binding domain-containing protein [Schleiferilactobacillus harbinensis]MCI1688596.1 AbrB/MazE/SpoVT family DNA-binding domain-containing protein [Schleiferilactobacillus harbinensis]MCI1784296.1 AbrB/MazE/SpoVT family DNA-binding domain-containing protein [Schleiferilactobacillus harbinensis]MCI1851794.1 AbrB/MazE/SpoVT family DNA-binding domain-containing protein [Schleiferilactobacillus harbinensis]